MSAPNVLYHDLMDHLRTVTARGYAFSRYPENAYPLALSSAPLYPLLPFWVICITHLEGKGPEVRKIRCRDEKLLRRAETEGKQGIVFVAHGDRTRERCLLRDGEHCTGEQTLFVEVPK